MGGMLQCVILLTAYSGRLVLLKDGCKEEGHKDRHEQPLGIGP